LKQARALAAVLRLAITSMAITGMAIAGTHASAADLRDPMRPANAPAATISRPAAVTPLQLQAVMTTGAARIAIVNGKIVHVGDKVSGALITEISSDSIHYTRGGKALVASLPNTRISVRANNTLQAGQP
jgi:hypothetical protein